MVVAFAPGGPVDILARRIASDLQNTFSQTFFVENLAGAGGRIGTRQVASAVGDGYTLLATSSAAHASAPALFPEKELGYDAVKGFSHIALIGHGSVGLIARADSRWNTLKDVMADVNSSGRPLLYASGGMGSLGHLAAEMMGQTVRMKMEHLSYRGSAPAQIDLLSGQIPMISDTLLPHMAQIRSGALKVISVFTPDRLAILPQTLTFAEQGWPGLIASSWFGLSGSPGISPAIVERINAAVRDSVASSENQKWMLAQGISPDGQRSPDAYASFVADEVSRWSKVVRAGNISVTT